MIVSGGQQRASVIQIHVSILLPALLPSRLPHNIKQNSIPFHSVPYNRSLLVIHFKYSSVCMSTPSSLTIHSLHPSPLATISLSSACLTWLLTSSLNQSPCLRSCSLLPAARVSLLQLPLDHITPLLAVPSHHHHHQWLPFQSEIQSPWNAFPGPRDLAPFPFWCHLFLLLRGSFHSNHFVLCSSSHVLGTFAFQGFALAVHSAWGDAPPIYSH